MATARTAQIEVIVGEPLLTPIESAFGHAAIQIDGFVYSRWHHQYSRLLLLSYLEVQSPYRSSTGYLQRNKKF